MYFHYYFTLKFFFLFFALKRIMNSVNPMVFVPNLNEIGFVIMENFYQYICDYSLFSFIKDEAPPSF